MFKTMNNISAQINQMQLSLGRIENRQIQQQIPMDIEAASFKVFSQWGEDGIIQFLIRHVPVQKKIFVEFGVEDYLESNTRFLLQNNQWAGLVLDASADAIAAIRRDSLYWQYNLKAEHAFLSTDNINKMLTNGGIGGDIGLLSIDIDGNDYWIWEAIECITPAIVICEYNSLFGSEHKLTIPYNPAFQRTKAHYSNLYYGASLPALADLAEHKGYALVASNSTGSNAFFVRKDCLSSLEAKSPEAVYKQTHVRESRNEAGKLSFLSFEQATRIIADLPLYNLDTKTEITFRQLSGSR
jgi:hypothetical protein